MELTCLRGLSVDSLYPSSSSDESRAVRSGFVGLCFILGEGRAGRGWKGTSIEERKASFLEHSSLELTLVNCIGYRTAQDR